MVKKMVKNVNDDDDELEELEMLLNEIPQATSHNFLQLYNRNLHVHGGDDDDDDHGMCGMYDDDPLTQIQYPCVSSPVSGFSLHSDGSSSSLFPSGHGLSDTGSPTPPPLEDLKSTMSFGSSYDLNPLWLDSVSHDSAVMKNANESLVGELGLCANMSQMYINKQQENAHHFKDVSMTINGIPFRDDCSLSGNGNSPINVHTHRHEDYCNYNNKEFGDCVGVQFPFPRSPISYEAEMSSATLSGLPHCNMGYLLRSRQYPKQHDTILPQLNGCRGSVDSPRNTCQLMNNYYYRGSLATEPTDSLSRNPMVDARLCAQKSGIDLMEETGMARSPNSSPCTNSRPFFGVRNSMQYSHPPFNARRAVVPPNVKIPQGNLEAVTSEGSFIIQGEGLNYVVGQGSYCSRRQNKAAVHGTVFGRHHLRRSELDSRHQGVGTYGSPRIGCSFHLPPKYNSLAEARGYMYLLAKDQHGCRFLQRVFEEGTPEDVQVIFDEIIGHVVELMMNPFGNYLMQRLLDVCNEEQRMHIMLIITEEPGQLVRISLNTHGTRVVQKLIETLKTRQQISLVVSALEPGFLALIKDLNGNHVVQRCLLCLSNEDNKFIFVAAAKYCVDIATHQHGCCVLQRCIGHSSGEHREKLIAEISANALLLAQDQYGNYAVQLILDLRIPSATASMSLQFEGNYVHLSRHKFGSHVIEKCLAVYNDENRTRVIHELLSAPHFEHLLQDPHANYVVQSALRHSEGRERNLLVDTIESYKGISRNSPYSKKIFSQKLLKK